MGGRLPPVRLTPRGVAFLVVGLLGVVLAYAAGWPALLAASLFLGGAVAAGVVTVVVAPPALRVERRIEPDVTDPRVPVAVRVTVSGSATSGLEWVDEVPRSLQVVGSARGGLPALGAGRRAALLEYTVTARRRGAVTIGPLRIARTDPLGLATVQRRIGGAGSLVVLPAVHTVEPPAATSRTDPDPASSAVFGLAGQQRDIVARTYRAGDPMRSVDWRATAHRGELMVRAEAAATAVSTALALETRAGAWPDPRAFEWAVECVASLAARLGQRRAGVHLVVDRSGTVTADAAGALLVLATTALADGAPRPPELVARVKGEDVQVVHVVTGRGSGSADLLRLPPLPHGAVGIVSVVGADRAPDVPSGWRVELLDPTRPVEEAWRG